MKAAEKLISQFPLKLRLQARVILQPDQRRHRDHGLCLPLRQAEGRRDDGESLTNDVG